jgi:hypothetical protein
MLQICGLKDAAVGSDTPHGAPGSLDPLMCSAVVIVVDA